MKLIRIEKIRELYEKGLIHILGTGVVNKIIAFIANVCIVRILTKEEYGIFGYADNIINFFLLLSGLGMINGIMQHGSENRPEEQNNAFYKYGLSFGIIVNLLLCMMVIIYVLFIPISIIESKKYIILLSLLPVTNYTFTFFCTILRCQKENKLYAKVVNINSLLYAICAIVGSYYIKILGIIFALYIANIISTMIGIKYTRYRNTVLKTTYKLKKHEQKAIVNYSAISCVNSAVANLLYLLDVFILGIYCKNPLIIASYKVATTIPIALLFIPQGINLFVYPYFAEHNTNYNLIKEYSKKMFFYSGIINVAISSFVIVFAPEIIMLLWGRKFLDATVLLRILTVNYFISATFKITAGNILATLRKVKENMYVSVFSGIANIILDILLVKKWGAVGASYATLSVMILSSLLLLPILIYNIKKLKI